MLLSNLKERSIDIRNSINECHNIMLTKRNQTQMRIYCMTPFIGIQIQGKLIYCHINQKVIESKNYVEGAASFLRRIEFLHVWGW